MLDELMMLLCIRLVSVCIRRTLVSFLNLVQCSIVGGKMMAMDGLLWLVVVSGCRGLWLHRIHDFRVVLVRIVAVVKRGVGVVEGVVECGVG